MSCGDTCAVILQTRSRETDVYVQICFKKGFLAGILLAGMGSRAQAPSGPLLVRGP